ncbi:MAG: glycosyltransferase family 4 protein, partial [Cyanobacteria bacterium J06641_5]
LRAWQQSEMSDRCKLAIVGDGPLGSTLRDLYAEERNILWLGYVAEARQRIDILRAADAFILPSLVEGLSLSLLEAMACGTACAATDAGADGEVLAGGAGIVLDTRRIVEQLSTLLPRLRDRPGWTTELGQRARQRILERYTLTRNLNQLEALYAELRQGRKLELSNSA